MLPAKPVHQICLVAIKLLVILELFNLIIVVPAAEKNIVSEFNGFQKVFKVLLHEIGCGVRFDVDISLAAFFMQRI